MTTTAGPFATELTAALGCRHPFISSAIGGPARGELASAVAKAGGFGLLGMVREPPELIEIAHDDERPIYRLRPAMQST
jgi:nitronate monooxygenase